jgi:predicted kinase
MESILFCGIQASGKTTFYLQQFFKTHMRISLDLLHTRHKERIFLQTCLRTQQRFVVDNTNPTRADRKRYIDMAKAYKFRVIVYYFSSDVESCLRRNTNRIGKEKVPVAGVRGTFKKLELPAFDEGIDQIYAVEIIEDNFRVTEWPGY